MGEEDYKQAVELLKEAKKDWKDLADKMISFTDKYATNLANINSKLDGFKPKSFLRTGSFWLAVIPYAILVFLALWAINTGTCIEIAGNKINCSPTTVVAQ